MTRRDHQPTEPTPLNALPDAYDDPAASALTRALASDADTINPTDRLADVRARARRRPAARPVAVAAAAVLVVGAATAVAAQLLGGGADDRGVAPAVSPSSRSDDASPSTPSTAASPSATPSATSQVTVALPVYYLGRDGDRLALFREFHRRTIQDTGAARLQLALDEATMKQSVTDPDLSSPWLPRSEPLTVSRQGDVVTVDVPAAEGQAGGRTAEQARLAVQQLVWTASAVEQDAGLGVRVLVDGRPGRLFGAVAVGGVVHRASPAYTVLGSIWVEQPAEGQTVGSPVTVTGSACTFEATVAWQLSRGGTEVRSGHTTATSGCPVRGSWRVPLGSLAAGTYTFRAFEPPASGQGPDREDTRTFVVR